MNEPTTTAVAIILAGLLVLMAGYSIRHTRFGPLLILCGVVGILSVITWYVLSVIGVLS